MKRLLMTGAALALILTGCGSTPPKEAPAPEPSGRAETTQLEFTVEGITEQVPAALYIGDGYSIYIPEEGWRYERDRDDNITEDTWESTANNEVELHVLRYAAYPDATVSTTKAHFAQDSGYVFEDLMGGELGDPLTGMDEDGDYLGFMAAEGLEGETFVVAWEYPARAAEGFGARLPQIASTFEITK